MATYGKKYQGFWMGNSWVSRCTRCGCICFSVGDEDGHNKVKCDKAKLVPIPENCKDPANQPKE